MNVYEIGKDCKLCKVKESVLVQILVLPDRIKPDHQYLLTLFYNTRNNAKKIKNNDYLCKRCKSDLKIMQLFRKQCVSSEELLQQIEVKSDDMHQVLIEDKLINLGVFSNGAQRYLCPVSIEDKMDEPDEILIEEILEDEYDLKESIVFTENEEVLTLDATEASEMLDDKSGQDEEHSVEEGDEEWLEGENIKQEENETPEEIQFEPVIQLNTATEDNSTVKHNAGPFLCEHCDAVYVKKFTLQVHQSKVHKIPIPERKHKLRDNEYDIYYGLDLNKVCEYCFYETESPEELSAHIATDHIEPIKYTCRECKNLFKTRNSLRAHYSNIHAGVRRPKPQFKCSYCDREFSQKSSLICHEEVVHLGIKGKYVCDICGHKANAKSDLTRHRHRHAKFKPHACMFEGCESRFLTTTELKSHTTHVHMELKPFACDLCEMRFAVRSSLEAHTREHRGIRPFLCKLCNKGFARKTNRDAHEKTHTKVKDQKCEVCNRIFLYPKQLKMHQMRVHQENRPLKCKYCPNAFEQPGPLKRHITIDHSEIKKTLSEEVVSEALRLHNDSCTEKSNEQDDVVFVFSEDEKELDREEEIAEEVVIT